MHLHQSIIDINTGKNVFSNEDGTMSQLFLNHIGGLQKFIPELLSLFAPNVNSFRRFLPDTSAPVNVEWGEENRNRGLLWVTRNGQLLIHRVAAFIAQGQRLRQQRP